MFRIPRTGCSSKFARDGRPIWWAKPSDMLDVSHLSWQLPVFLCFASYIFPVRMLSLELLSNVSNAMYSRAGNSKGPDYELQQINICLMPDIILPDTNVEPSCNLVWTRTIAESYRRLWARSDWAQLGNGVILHWLHCREFACDFGATKKLLPSAYFSRFWHFEG